MASGKKKVAKAVPFDTAQMANITKANPYIQRLVEDAELRDNVRVAFDSSKSAYNRLSNGKAPARALLEDKKLQRDLTQAYEALRDATLALSEGPKKRRRGLTFGRVLLLVLITAGIALAVSESLRSKVLDTLFGAEEEFQYTPPPSPPTSAPPTAPVSAA